VTGEELRQRIKHLGLSYRAAAPRLGLSLAGLHHNMRDERPISRQTEIILDYLEHEQTQEGLPQHQSLNAVRQAGRARRAAG